VIILLYDDNERGSAASGRAGERRKLRSADGSRSDPRGPRRAITISRAADKERGYVTAFGGRARTGRIENGGIYDGFPDNGGSSSGDPRRIQEIQETDEKDTNEIFSSLAPASKFTLGSPEADARARDKFIITCYLFASVRRDSSF